MPPTNTDNPPVVQPIPATSLTVDQVNDIITQAQAGGNDPVSVAMQIFDRLGDNIAVAGDVLRQALGNSNVPLTGPLATLLAAVQGISKSGNQVTITNTQETTTQISGTSVRFQPSVSFNVSLEGTFPTISEIEGASVHKIFWLDLQELQLRSNHGNRVLHVETSGGSRDIPLAA